MKKAEDKKKMDEAAREKARRQVEEVERQEAEEREKGAQMKRTKEEKQDDASEREKEVGEAPAAPLSGPSGVRITTAFAVIKRVEEEAQARGMSSKDGRVYGLTSEGVRPKVEEAKKEPSVKVSLAEGLKKMRIYSDEPLASLKKAKPPELVEFDLPPAPGQSTAPTEGVELLWHGTFLSHGEKIMEHFWTNEGCGLLEHSSRSVHPQRKYSQGTEDDSDVFGSDMFRTPGGYPQEAWAKARKGYKMYGQKIYKDQPYPMLLIIGFHADKS